MTEAEQLAEAYFTLGMKPGGSKEAVHSRWKRLAMVWHSDRFPSEDAKREADEELKNINNARDILKKHFETSHKNEGSCACNASSAASQNRQPGGTGPGPGPGKRRNTQDTDREEAEAARRSKERADQTARAAAERTAQEAKARTEANAATAAAEKSKQHAEQTAAAESEKLRWKIAIWMAVAWVMISFSAFCLTSVKGWWTHLNDQWNQERQWKADQEQQKRDAEKAAADQAQQEQEQAAADQKRRDAEDQERKNQQIARDRETIKIQQNIIDHCTSEIAKAQAQIYDPNVAQSEKNKSTSWQMQQQKYLGDAQANYNFAQQDLANLTGTKAPPQLGGNTDTPVPQISPAKLPELPDSPVQKFTTPHWTPNSSVKRFADQFSDQKSTDPVQQPVP
jgi:curved DNA-binding protein CbpA